MRETPLAPPPPRYSEWLDFAFGRMGRDSDDEWSMDWTFDASARDLADLYRYGMDHCGSAFEAYTDRQLAVGLNALLFCVYSNIAEEVMGRHADEQRAVAAIRSLARLYSDGLTARSPHVLGHLSERSENPLWYVTYMLWDVSPIDQYALKTDARIDALFATFEAGLASSNIACVESALHGLGHASDKIRPRAQRAITAWIDSGPNVRPELIAYAKRAHGGRIQ